MVRSVCLALLFGLALSGAASAAPQPPTKPIELDRYFGRWYEIARIPNRFERGPACSAPSADYSQDASGKVSMVQTCRVGSPTGPEKVYRATGRFLDPGVNARLKLTFFVVFSKEYWVLDHGADYSWAVVGDSSGRFLWLMARSSTVAKGVQDEMVERAKTLGYDTGKLEFPAH